MNALTWLSSSAVLLLVVTIVGYATWLARPVAVPAPADRARTRVATKRRRGAVHRTVLVVDVEAFGDRRRTNLDQVVVRSALYRTLRQAFRQAGISHSDCEFEDRGDGVLILAPAEMIKGPFVEELPGALARALHAHNTTHPPEQRIRLRMALHAGEVNYDDHGVTATAINLTFRLVDAARLKSELANSSGALAVITSSWFFDEVVRHSSVCDRLAYRRVQVVVKETATTAWIHAPDQDASASVFQNISS
ncbi:MULTISPECIES: hypothetical protein [unclassified Saccharothrix]|uniref:hypothetical protein n=1 Tax=unclassified Saccharothrix TaxID=2593673 RepID=UPI00307CFEA1